MGLEQSAVNRLLTAKDHSSFLVELEDFQRKLGFHQIADLILKSRKSYDLGRPSEAQATTAEPR